MADRTTERAPALERKTDTGGSDRGWQLIPDGFDGEPGGCFYRQSDPLDDRWGELLAAYTRTVEAQNELDAFRSAVQHDAGFWQAARPLLDDIAEREAQRRLVLAIDVQAVAAAQRAYLESLLDGCNIDNFHTGVTGVLGHVAVVLDALAGDDRIDPALRARLGHLASEVTR